MPTAEVCKEVEAKPHQPVFVGNHDHHDLPSHNLVDQGQEPWTFEIQSTANLTDPVSHRNPTGGTKLLQHLTLIRKIGLLCPAGDAHIDHRCSHSALALR